MTTVARIIQHPGAVTIWCCLCLNIDNARDKIPATHLVNGYSLCKAHVPLIARPDFAGLIDVITDIKNLPTMNAT